MKRLYQSILWKLLLMISIAILSLAGYSQWQRYQADQNYQALATLKESIPFTTDNQDNTGGLYEFQYRENPTKEWLNINPDFIGWISIENTNINYPYVRSMDNEDYLDRDFYRQKSSSGAIFMDYRNLGNFNDSHMILYGHNMKSKTMFHQLNNYKDKAFFDENHLIQISGLYGTKTFLVFSAYEVSANDYAFQLNFQDQEEYQLYLKSIAALSIHSSELVFDASRKLLTLATCSYGVENGRFVIHALEIPD